MRCCRAMTLSCVACAQGLSAKEYCLLRPNSRFCKKKGTQNAIRKGCCRAKRLECVACAAGQSTEEYCESNPNSRFCKQKSTQDGITFPGVAKQELADEEEIVVEDVRQENSIAVPAGVTTQKVPDDDVVEDLANVKKKVVAKKAKRCCKAMTLSCIACARGLSAKEYCESNPDSRFCKQKSTQDGITIPGVGRVATQELAQTDNEKIVVEDVGQENSIATAVPATSQGVTTQELPPADDDDVDDLANDVVAPRASSLTPKQVLIVIVLVLLLAAAIKSVMKSKPGGAKRRI